jgi:GxxExxY protein
MNAKTPSRQGRLGKGKNMSSNQPVEPDSELDALAHRVIGAAIEVHRRLGPGLDESLYEEALAIELRLQAIGFARQVIIPVTYRDEIIGEKRLDLVIEGKLILELKAVEQLAPIHKAQVVTYLKITGHKLALLINFNSVLLRNGINRIIRS